MSLGYLLPLIFVSFLYILMQCLIGKDSLIPFGLNLKFDEWFGLTFITLFSNYFIPFSGLGVRAAYLKRKKDLGLDSFIVSMANITLIELTIYSLLGIIPILYSDAISNMRYIIGYAIVAASIGFSIIPLLIKLNIITKILPSKFVPIYEQSKHVIGYSRNNALIALWTIGHFIAFTGMFYISFAAIGLNVGINCAMLMACLANFSFLIRLAPAGAGTFEAAIIIAGDIFGLDISQSLVVSAFIRGGILACIIPLGPWFIYKLGIKTKA